MMGPPRKRHARRPQSLRQVAQAICKAAIKGAPRLQSERKVGKGTVKRICNISPFA